MCLHVHVVLEHLDGLVVGAGGQKIPHGAPGHTVDGALVMLVLSVHGLCLKRLVSLTVLKTSLLTDIGVQEKSSDNLYTALNLYII